MVHSNSQFSKHKSHPVECFVSLGGNATATLPTLIRALHAIEALPETSHLSSSRLYETTPVSPLPQPLYLNACARFSTTLSPFALFAHLEKIEATLGKVKKPKSAPRLIDLDLLFYGKREMHHPHLTLPHPRLRERLFVLRPLSDLRDVGEWLARFTNPHRETVTPLPHPLPFQVPA